MNLTNPKKLLVILIIALNSSFSFGQLRQAQIEIGSAHGYSLCNSMVQTNDGGYALTGYSQYHNNGDIFVLKLDSNAAVSWAETIGGPALDNSFSIIQTMDGGYALTGLTASYGILPTSWFSTYVLKLNSAGTVEWTKTISDTLWGEGRSIIQTRDKGYVIAGDNFTTSYYDTNAVIIMKLDSLGNILWSDRISGTLNSNNQSGSIVQTTDGGFAFVGYTNSYGAGPYNVFVVKLDSAGIINWAETIGGKIADYGYAIIQTKDGGYAITGQTNSYGDTVNGDVYVIKLDKLGVIKWTKAIGGKYQEYGDDIIQTKDGGYAITGLTYSYGDTVNGNVYVLNLDSLGNLKWTNSIGGKGEDFGYSIVQTKDGGYAIGGDWDFSTSGKAYFIKLDSLGNTCTPANRGGIVNSGGTVTGISTVKIYGGARITSSDSGMVSIGDVTTDMCTVSTSVKNITQNENSIDVYPNPSNGKFQLGIRNEELGINNTVEVYNVLGEKVYSQFLAASSATSFLINMSNQPNGIYLYKVMAQSGEILGQGKLVIQK